MAKPKVKMKKCQYCGNYPRLRKVYDEYKYVCCWDNPVGKAGFWHTTKNGARRAWNKRSKGEYA